MISDGQRLQRALHRYRVMFRITIGLAIAGAIAALFGALNMFVSPSAEMIGGGVLFVVAAIALGYKMVLSTMKILETAAEQGIDVH
jgi:hypothetical protein